MYTVFIVDDEVLIRKRIRLGIDWESCGYTVQNEAGGAEEAMRLMKATPPDLAIIDIAMPGKNGVEMVHELREQGYTFEIIMLTGHKNFDYAKQALYDGVFSYLLKPMHEDEMIETLCRLRGILDSRRQTASDVRGLMKARERTVLDGQLLQAVEHGLLPAVGQEYLPAALQGKWSLAILQGVAAPSDYHECYDVNAPIYLLKNPHAPQELLCLLAESGNCRDESIRLTLLKTLTNKLGTSDEVAIAMSESFSEVTALQTAYEQAQTVLHNRIFFSPPFCAYRELSPFLTRQFSFSAMCRQELYLLLQAGNLPECRDFLHRLFRQLQQAGMPFSAWCYVLTLLLVQLEQAAADTGCQPGEHGLTLRAEVLLLQAQSIEALAEALMEQLQTVVDYQLTEPRQAICMRIQKYIQAHYADPQLSLTSISEELQLTPSYVSRLFKKEMGISTIGYIVEVRMTAAKELLKKGMQVRTVALQVGYIDEYYFSRCFKKQFGNSPNLTKNLYKID